SFWASFCAATTSSDRQLWADKSDGSEQPGGDGDSDEDEDDTSDLSAPALDNRAEPVTEFQSEQRQADADDRDQRHRDRERHSGRSERKAHDEVVDAQRSTSDKQ